MSKSIDKKFKKIFDDQIIEISQLKPNSTSKDDILSKYCLCLFINFKNGHTGTIEIVLNKKEKLFFTSSYSKYSLFSSWEKYNNFKFDNSYSLQFLVNIWDETTVLHQDYVDLNNSDSVLDQIIELSSPDNYNFNIVTSIDDFIKIYIDDKSQNHNDDSRSSCQLIEYNYLYYMYLFNDNRENLDLLKLSVKYGR